MDVEASMTDDETSQGYDRIYVDFLERIKNEVLIPRGKELRVNAYAMWGEGVPYYYRFHNYKMFAESADKNGNATINEIQLMTYDFAWNGSSAGPSTPVWWFREVGEWCVECFNIEKNPKAKLTIDNLYFGSAGYGHRWGMHDQDVVKSGSIITYRNLLDWQNGLYRHFHTDDSSGETTYVYHDQEFLNQASIQDEESKNEVMYPHVYDIFHPGHVKVSKQDGGSSTASIGTYNRLDYATTNFKVQVPKWGNIISIGNEPSNFSGKAFPNALAQSVKDYAEDNYIDILDLPIEMRQQQDMNMDPTSIEFNHLVKTVDGIDRVFAGWYNERRKYQEKYLYDEQGNVISAMCEPEPAPEGRINYELNVPTAGNYRLVAITAFSWYTQAKLGGFANGQQFKIGGDMVPEWYPFFMKGAHFYDVGSFDFNSGLNTISIHGELSDPNTPIYGFIICSDFDQNFTGGELTMNTNINPMIGKKGSPLPIPTTLAMASKMLRRDARPSLLWDDEFRTYGEGTNISNSSYYQKVVQDYKYEGGGDFVAQDGINESTNQPIYKCYSEPQDIGFSQGEWTQKDFALHYDSPTSGQLVLSKKWSVNLSIEETIRVARGGGSVGVRFYAQNDGSVGDGYLLLVDFKNGTRTLKFENAGTTTTIASQSIGNISEGHSIIFKVLSHNGVGQFYINGVKAFVEGSGNPVTANSTVNKTTGEVLLERTSGAVGFYANDAEVFCTHLGIGTTDRWETMEKFEVTVDGTTKEFGQIARTGYSYDEFGYLIYSGLNEISTRDSGQGEDSSSVSLDYEVEVFDWASWEGAKEVKINLRDAGVWFGELLIGDREGMSIIWAGDAWSFLETMNMAVNEYGAKGIGLWTMGQEDPYLFEFVPDVVPKSQSKGAKN